MQANLMLLVTAAIWGFAFVAQRVAMDHMGPFSFNAVRFLLGAASLLPLIWFFSRKKAVATTPAAKTSIWLAVVLRARFYLWRRHYNKLGCWIPPQPRPVLSPVYI